MASYTSQILEDLQNRQLDLGYIFADSPNPRISTHKLFTAELVVAAPKAMEDQLKEATWSDLAALSWIAFAPLLSFSGNYQ